MCKDFLNFRVVYDPRSTFIDCFFFLYSLLSFSLLCHFVWMRATNILALRLAIKLCLFHCHNPESWIILFIIRNFFPFICLPIISPPSLWVMYHIKVQISKATFIIVINSREGLLKVILDFEAVYLTFCAWDRQF